MPDCMQFDVPLSLEPARNATPLFRATNNLPTYGEADISLFPGRSEKPEMGRYAVSVFIFISSWLHLPILLYRSSMKTLGSSSRYTCNGCPPNVGLANSSYEIDFTKQTSIPPDWTISNWATVSFGAKGAEFTVSKRFESPQLWTNFYIHYGKVEIVAQVAPGTGIVSSAVLMSDDLDEIDWEWSGNNFRDIAGKGQNNYYGKGIVGDYDRGSFFSVASPQTQFHTYTIDWTATQLTWSVDGTAVRTLYAANTDSGSHQYPQTPSKFQIGIWAGGDPGNAWGTVDWAGGYTDFTKAPFTYYVKSVKITNYNPAYAYNWTDNSGSSKSIKIISKPVVVSSSVLSSSTSTTRTRASTTTSASAPAKASTTCAGVPPSVPTQDGIVSGCTQWYTAKPGDTCGVIAAKFNISIEQFMTWNPAVDPPLCYNMWLNYGYCVSTDCTLVITPSSTASTTSSSRSTTVSSATGSSSTIVVSSAQLSTTTISSTSIAATSRVSSNIIAPTVSSSASLVVSTSTAPKSSTSSAAVSPASSSSSTVSLSSPTLSLVSPTTLCPDADGQTILSGDNKAYTIICASDTNKGSYADARALKSYLDCLNACDDAADTGCSAFTYVGNQNGRGSGICYLKATSGTFLPAGNNYISGALAAKDSSSSSATQKGSSTPSKSTTSSTVASTSSTVFPLASPSAVICPEVDAQSFVMSQSGSLYFMRCSSDTDVGSYADSKASSSYKDCMNTCDSDTKCVAFTYVGGKGGSGSGVCWFKDSKGGAVLSGPNYVAGFLATRAPSSASSSSSLTTGNLAVSSSSSTTTSSRSTTSSSTSTASTSWAISSTGSNYTIYRSSDTNYGAYSSVQARNSFLDCTTACDGDSKCKAWTYAGGKNGQGSGTCWLKSQLGQPVPAGNNLVSGSHVTQSIKMRRAVSSWWNSVTLVKPIATKTQRIATAKPKSPANPPWARYYAHGGRWMWNGHDDYEWHWN
ncbi:concanavalin A-like lectin/glucanase [Aureobasidium subglaciale]|nr:concanavalin A-like lectin/glucanase [Aureobasidium subglaciale]